MDNSSKTILAIGWSVLLIWFLVAWIVAGIKVALTALGIVGATILVLTLIIWFWTWFADKWW